MAAILANELDATMRAYGVVLSRRSRPLRVRRALVAISFCVPSLLAQPFLAQSASAQTIIKHDEEHPEYAVEIEPHATLGLFLPPGDGDGFGIGSGIRATIPVAHRGFIEGVNDSVGVGFGIDWVYHFGAGASAGECAEYRGTGNRRICVRVAGAGGPSHYFYVPAVMQWNFFLTDEWSVFGEPGLGMYFQVREFDGSLGVGAYPVFQAGGRYHLSENFTLTMRVGYPYQSVGVSVLF